MPSTVVFAPLGLGLCLLASGSIVSSQGFGGARDPGVRPGAAAAGGPLAGLTGRQQQFFEIGRDDFNEAEEVDEGLGPRMNLDGCGGCHIQPAIGGTSPAVNPQVAFASKSGGTDKVPSFIRINGPIREARFIRNPDGSPDGGVTSIFTITGRTGSDGCRLAQPDFAAQMAAHNVSFRIPTPVFGAGLIEQIEDSTILANQAANASTKTSLGIRGRPNVSVSGRTISGAVNRNGNDGSITRFGWKAQNVSLMIFSGEAYNVEMGITNELFQNERDQTPSCYFADNPNDIQNMEAELSIEGVTAIQNFSNFQRLLAPPTPSATAPGTAASIGRGRAQFTSVGCALCHTPSMRTGNRSAVAALNDQVANLYSDLLVHDMGFGLADGVSQGNAGPREFRTAPLWGLGQRIFFLHDGRTSDLMQAIQAHRSFQSEANSVIDRFNSQSEGFKQDLLNFLRSL
jgi:CxxC motif-containing protein (DUF1111 family)